MRSAPMPLPSQTSEIDAHLHHADAFVATGQVVLALGMYRTAALLAEQRHDVHRALAIHARIARIDPDPGARARIGELQLALGQRAEAATTLDTVVRDELRAGRWPQALHAATTAVSAAPTAPRRLTLADLAQRLGQVELAVDQLQAVAVEELREGRVGRAQSLCARALGLAPEHLPTLRTAVDAHLRARDAHRAVAAIRAILARAPHDVVALEGMADAFVILGKRHAAAEVLRLLATQLAATGPHAHGDARALVHRALSWHPENEGLRQLDRELTDRPRPVAREIVAESTRVIDLADLVEVRQVVRPAVPMQRATPPVPTQRAAPAPTQRAALVTTQRTAPVPPTKRGAPPAPPRRTGAYATRPAALARPAR